MNDSYPSLKTPIVFIVFNRPELTQCVLARIREARPFKLLVICDGPRIGRTDDDEKVAAVRRIIAEGVDWPCEVLTNFSYSNLGCRARPASGINWAFSLVEEAIILEDDCLPDLSFFGFCEEMLERFRDDDRVMHINGTNFIAPHTNHAASYFFSKYVWVWGWATWRSSWRHYDYAMASWDDHRLMLREIFDTRREEAFWMSTFENARQNWEAAHTWDFPWIYSCWIRNGLSVMPAVNLVENLGFGPDATHTKEQAPHLRVCAGNISVNRHPFRQQRSRFRDDKIFRSYAGEHPNRSANLAGAMRVLYRRFTNFCR